MELRTGDRVFRYRAFPEAFGTVTGISGDGLVAAILWDGTERSALEDVINLRKVMK